ncbi:hypothetical protein PLESTB_000696200 [Pleodorina starrii]|uniref:Uncharacterized protein n=1 Tax=Pleodorina starrii TaxID=330485 RepID=A0A9W6BIT2_9CHLO|nr:hypothetical protein PLESTM_001220700 [Pleodorina starrii]GLC52991.1 hypothetical protein PLESTB_000696200 [Pleodorina starrii]GLC65288.1 hypothetical protein PLESTF_000272600 [Pleodorina starrii]
MDTLGNSREEGLRRALSLAVPVGTQLGSVGLESLGRAADGTLKLAWSVASVASSAVRTAGASAAFVNRSVLAPLSSFAFGSNSSSSCNVQFSTHMCPQQLLVEKGRKHHPSRYQRAANNLRSGTAKCSIRRQLQPSSLSASPLASKQAELIAHLAASCALSPSSELQDEQSYGREDLAVAQWTVNTLGLQSSML